MTLAPHTVGLMGACAASAATRTMLDVLDMTHPLVGAVGVAETRDGSILLVSLPGVKRLREGWFHHPSSLATNAAIASPVPIAATIADPDPQITAAVRLAQWVGLGVTATDVGNLRLALMALLPNIAGLVLCFGMVLRR
jgi:hypothetical protein